MTVETMRSRLTDEDIARLIKGERQEDRALSAFKICRRISQDGLSDHEREAANQILTLMAHDAAEMVRKALAVTLKASPHLPQDIARRLIDDIDDIAIPVLETSPVLTDEDLIRVIDAGKESHTTAIARRDHVSGSICEAIAETGGEASNAALARNNGADMTDIAYASMLTRHGSSSRVTDQLIERRSLPIDVTEKLVSLISDVALKRLSKKHALPPQLAVELAEGARERASIDLIDQADCAEDIQRFVQQLHLNGRLTPSLIVRAAACGSMRFVEWSLSELAAVPHSKAWLLVHDAGPLGLKALFDRTGLPPRIYSMLKMAVEIYHETGPTAPRDREAAQKMMIERVLTRYQAFEEDDLNYLLERLDASETQIAITAPAGQPQAA